MNCVCTIASPPAVSPSNSLTEPSAPTTVSQWPTCIPVRCFHHPISQEAFPLPKTAALPPCGSAPQPRSVSVSGPVSGPRLRALSGQGPGPTSSLSARKTQPWRAAVLSPRPTSPAGPNRHLTGILRVRGPEAGVLGPASDSSPNDPIQVTPFPFPNSVYPLDWCVHSGFQEDT